MLLALIALTWLTIATFVLAVCQCASRSDRRPLLVLEGMDPRPQMGLPAFKAEPGPARIRISRRVVAADRRGSGGRQLAHRAR
jgi:hypothetical protein